MGFRRVMFRKTLAETRAKKVENDSNGKETYTRKERRKAKHECYLSVKTL